MGRGESVHCGMLGILLIAEPCKACRVFCWTRTHTSVLAFPLGAYSFLKQNQTRKWFWCS